MCFISLSLIKSTSSSVRRSAKKSPADKAGPERGLWMGKDFGVRQQVVVIGSHHVTQHLPACASRCLPGWAQTSHLIAYFANDNCSHYEINHNSFLALCNCFFTLNFQSIKKGGLDSAKQQMLIAPYGGIRLLSVVLQFDL